MKRRDFIRMSALGFTYLNSGKLFAYDKSADKITSADKTINYSVIDPIIPFNFFMNRKEKMLSQMLELKQRFGLRRFLLTDPMEYVRLTGYPSSQVYQNIGEKVLYVKDQLASHDIEVGWWCAPSLRSGAGAPFQYITDASGAISKISLCPMDPMFMEDFSDNVATVVKISHPFMVQFEDDYELSWQPPEVNFGCFCPLHIAEFSRRQHKQYTREGLVNLFKEVTPESIKLRRAWAELTRDSLVNLASMVRKKIDEIAPDTRVMLCQSGTSDFDGDFTEAVTQAFAGKTRPAVRLYGTSYGSDDSQSLPGNVFHALYSVQHLPSHFECYHESDTYPHTRFFMSAAKIKSLITATLSYGFDDSLFYVTQYLDNPLEEKGYAKMFHSEIKRFEALKAAVRDCDVTGVEIVHRPFAHIVNPYSGSGRPGTASGDAWVSALGRFGIPYTAKNGKVKLIAGNMVEMMKDEEIESLLKGGVLMDGGAAYSLCEKGWGDMIGAKGVSKGKEANFCYEGLRKTTDFSNVEGDLMYNYIFAPAGTESGSFFVLDPMNEAEIITDFLDGEEKPVIPGMYRFQNKLGGRVAITALNANNRSSGLFNYKKKEMISQIIEWLGDEPLPVFVKDLPNVFCIFNRSRSKNYAIVTLINLSSDVFNLFSLQIAPEWQNKRAELMNENGKWKEINFKKRANIIEVNEPLFLMKPVILKLS
ncbi:MAG TPA: hypothetical protein VLZ33_03550 [Dysgonamonadaceae bacterium]|nr:hypothetical protein [Dysgonamonadaceae bacterium]